MFCGGFGSFNGPGFVICDSAWHFEPYGGIWSKF